MAVAQPRNITAANLFVPAPTLRMQPPPPPPVPGAINGGNAADAGGENRREIIRRLQRDFRNFIEADLGGAGPYTRRIAAMLRRGESRLIINLAHLRLWDPAFTRRLLSDPSEYIEAFQTGLASYL